MRFRLAAELKQSYSYVEIIRCLGSSGLQDIMLERVGLLNYKDAPLALPLPADMGPLETERIGHELMRSLGETLGWDPRHFSGTLVLRGRGNASEEAAQWTKQVLTRQGFTILLEPLSAF